MTDCNLEEIRRQQRAAEHISSGRVSITPTYITTLAREICALSRKLDKVLDKLDEIDEECEK